MRLTESLGCSLKKFCEKSVMAQFMMNNEKLEEKPEEFASGLYANLKGQCETKSIEMDIDEQECFDTMMKVINEITHREVKQ